MLLAISGNAGLVNTRSITTDDHDVTVRTLLSGVLLVVVSAACSSGADGLTLATLEEEPILDAIIPGMTAKRITHEQGGSSPMVTQLMEVSGSWETASVNLAKAVLGHGWTVESINCVGTGNDVIAKKLIADEWALLESGAGTRAAGIILQLDPSQQPPRSLSVQGRCPAELISAVS